MHADERLIIRVKHRPFSRYAIERVWAIQHNDCDAASLACADAEVERPNESVITRSDILKVDQQNIERFEHFRCRLAMFAVKAINRNVQTRIFVTFPFDHVILRLTEKSVLWSKERSDSIADGNASAAASDDLTSALNKPQLNSYDFGAYPVTTNGVIVPGGGWNDRGSEGAWAEAQRGDLPRAISEHHTGGGHVAGVCTGGMLLAAAGVIGGRPATTHARARDELREAGADVRHDRVVDHGDLLTAGGVTSGIDLALWILEREFGARIADAVAREMEHERVAAVRAAQD